jgi:hypothetical protein
LSVANTCGLGVIDEGVIANQEGLRASILVCSEKAERVTEESSVSFFEVGMKKGMAARP